MKENNFGGPSDILHDIIGLKSNDECFVPKVIKIERDEINYPVNHFAYLKPISPHCPTMEIVGLW